MITYRRVKRKLFPNAPEFERERFAKKQNPEIKILLAGLMMSSNLGDGVISDCVKYLVRKATKENKIKNLKITTRDIKNQRTSKDLAAVRNSDAVIFTGGGMIKYQVENLPVAMDRFVSRAEHYGIPVYFNSVGVEGYDEQDENCRLLCDMLSRYCVKGITCRDYAEFLNEHYLKNDIKSCRVSDPAVWTAQAYDIQRDAESQVIGLGVARADLFTDYGIDYTKEDLLNLWKSIIDALDNKGVKWKLFTNGTPRDEKFLVELAEYIGKAKNLEEIAVKKPETPQELVENISKFKGIVACRMHANIVAYSLDIPCVGLVWNDKLTAFAQNVGIAHRFIKPHEFKSDLILNLLEDAIETGYDQQIKEKELSSAYESLKDFIVPFAKNVVRCRRRDLTNVPIVCFGLPNLESDALNREFFCENIEYYVTDDKSLVGTECLGKRVFDVKKLKVRASKRPFVLVSTTLDYAPCDKILKSFGYEEKYDYVNMHAYKRYVFKKGDVFIDKSALESK